MRIGSHFGRKIGQLEQLPEEFVNVPVLLGRRLDESATGETVAQAVGLFGRDGSVKQFEPERWTISMATDRLRVRVGTSYHGRICYRR